MTGIAQHITPVRPHFPFLHFRELVSLKCTNRCTLSPCFSLCAELNLTRTVCSGEIGVHHLIYLLTRKCVSIKNALAAISSAKSDVQKKNLTCWLWFFFFFLAHHHNFIFIQAQVYKKGLSSYETHPPCANIQTNKQTNKKGLTNWGRQTDKDKNKNKQLYSEVREM